MRNKINIIASHSMCWRFPCVDVISIEQQNDLFHSKQRKNTNTHEERTRENTQAKEGGSSNNSGNRNLITLLKYAYLCGAHSAHSVCQCWYANWFDGISRQREKMSEKVSRKSVEAISHMTIVMQFYIHTHAGTHTLTQWLRTWFYGTIM